MVYIMACDFNTEWIFKCVPILFVLKKFVILLWNKVVFAFMYSYNC